MNYKHSIFAAAVAGMALLSLVACGGGNSDDASTTAAIPTAPTPTAPTPTAPSPTAPTPTAPTPSTPPTATGGSAMACLPAASNAVGYREVLDYQVTESNPGQPAATGTRRNDSLVTGTVVIAGKTASRTLDTETFNGTSVERTASYEVIEGTRLITLRLDNLNGTTLTDINTYEPATYVDFSLTAGQSHTQNYVIRSSDPTGGATQTESATDTVLFVGRESVTVPLGTFADTCRFTFTQTFSGATSVLDIWVTAGSGIPVKFVSRAPVPGGESVRTESLSAGTVNGAAFRP